MKLVPFATRVRMDVKAFPSRPSVPLLITNSQRRNSILFMTAMKYLQLMALSNCVSYAPDVFPCHARREPHLARCPSKYVVFYYAPVIRLQLLSISSRDSVKYWYVASNDCVQVNGLQCDSEEVKVSMRRNSTLSGVRESV
ncbi:hypothetical protein T03_17445 [Trichinella britovi]|uniref:Uncharacterized protein n=1 Tax=Trichinella britovi TaxID=45882 RepID=A0A0V1CEN1_TRIBR|nr:hypothetical protein T03_17445 [Trichinella britovi]